MNATRTKFQLLAMSLAGFLLIVTPPTSFAAAERVAFVTTALPGMVVVQTAERRLYLILPDGLALRYVVGVGRDGRQWSGTSRIAAKYLRPHWMPPAEIRRDNPHLPAMIPGGSSGNPLGAAAITLSGTDYAIHGTNAPETIGDFVSYGCIRMYNADIADLYNRVQVGATVLVR